MLISLLSSVDSEKNRWLKNQIWSSYATGKANRVQLNRAALEAEKNNTSNIMLSKKETRDQSQIYHVACYYGC